MANALKRGCVSLMQRVLLSGEQKENRSKSLLGQELTLDVNGTSRTIAFYPASQKPAPVYFDIHGGGFAWGTIWDGDLICDQIRRELGMTVCSLDYPLAPQTLWPAQQEYLYETICTLLEHAAQYGLCRSQVVLGGRSAGANLAAVLCRMARERGEFQVACQILDHPYLDLCGTIADRDRYAGKGALSPKLMNLLAQVYARPEQRKLPDCSPVTAGPGDLASLPPAIIQTCGKDSLRRDGDLYAELLAKAGVPVRHHCVEEALHGFTQEDSPLGAQGRDWIVEQLREQTADWHTGGESA